MPRPIDRSSSYIPGLDGLRALAVIAVLGYHFDIPHMTGGLLGVSMFFTLSGFLITGILLTTWERTGGFELRRFWTHRARRLLPALVVVLVVVLAVTAAVDREALGKRWDEAVGAIAYVSNWTTIAGGGSYFDYFAGPTPFEHLWSLAIEEQFYLLWPLVLLLLLRLTSGKVAKVARVTLALAACSFVLLAVLAQPGFDNTRAYEGTDTRAGELLVGAALAMLYRPARVRRSSSIVARFGVQLVGVAALSVMGLLVVSTTYYSISLYRGGLLILSIATAALIAVICYPGSFLGKAIGIPPMRWVGERSYGIYLWHMPVVAFTPQNLLEAYSWRLAMLHITLSVGLAALSWSLVENPIRQHGFKNALRRSVPHFTKPTATRPSAAIGAAALASVSVLSLTSASLVAPSTASLSTQDMLSPDLPPLPPPESPVTEDHGNRDSPNSTNHTPDRRKPDRGPKAGAPQDGGKVARAGTQHRRHTNGSEVTPVGLSAHWQTSCNSVVHVGDSTSVGLMDPNYLPTRGDRIDAQYRGVGVEHVQTDILGARSIVETYHGEPNAEEATQSRMDDGYNGCWVFAMGTNDTANQSVGGVVDIDDRIARLMDQIDGAPAMWLTVKTLLSSGPWAEDHMQKWNAALIRACAKYPNMAVYDWASQVNDSWYISDGIHFTTPGYRERAQRTARALAVAFPADGQAPDGCLVVPS